MVREVGWGWVVALRFHAVGGRGVGRCLMAVGILLAMPAERAYVPNMTASPPLMTAEDLLETSIPNKATELVRGRLIVREPPGSRHGKIAMNLAVRLANHVERLGAGQIFAAETGFTLFRAPDTVRAPDIGYVRRERLPD